MLKIKDCFLNYNNNDKKNQSILFTTLKFPFLNIKGKIKNVYYRISVNSSREK